ncbi:MAG: sodium/solute symporter [bacterium]
MISSRIKFSATLLLGGLLLAGTGTGQETPDPIDTTASLLSWSALPPLPAEIGVAGPFVGVHQGVLIVAGGANFPLEEGEDLWSVPKVWHSESWILLRDSAGDPEWRTAPSLKNPRAYGASVSTRLGVVCVGGSDEERAYSDAFLLEWDPGEKTLIQLELPNLPRPMVHGAAARIEDWIYVTGGQDALGLDSAGRDFWRLDLSNPKAWEQLPDLPTPARAFHLLVAQHNGFEDCLYLLGGRSQDPEVAGLLGIRPSGDLFEFSPKRHEAQQASAPAWRQRASAPQPTMAGTAIAVGQSHLFVLGGDSGALFAQQAAEPEFIKRHPGFECRAFAYHTITDTWIDAGPTPINQVTTQAVEWQGTFVIPSGEVRPRVRTRDVWQVTLSRSERGFGTLNLLVLGAYLLAMLGVGVYFMRRNKTTDDYFRGGKRIVWWAAGCSIFATMLSSITFMAIPAKAYAQDWVYLLGSFMILAVAPLVVFLVLPFFRRIDATSAYEYLELRFNRAVRQFASALFILFHLFRMGIVMSLAGLALAAATPLSGPQCVLVMGVLSIVYCTLGGIEAVIWTDTIQTVVLLGGALLCLLLMIAQLDGGLGQAVETALSHDKLHAVNFHWDATSANLALWVVVIGALGQNISSYTADQAVVQRYMTTPSTKHAAQSIWLATALAIPASLLFFALGTGLFVFYQAHPDRIDPGFMTDQIFPLFIVEEVPVGLAGLIVAGIFAAAQSTVSTSMNSTATAVVTDFLRPMSACKSEEGYLRVARGMTLLLGILGTLLGLLFVSPDIKSLFDQFLRVIGIFMGVLGGLFALGMLTRRCTGLGAMLGVTSGAALLFAMPLVSSINGYLYASIGIITCLLIGYGASLLSRLPARDLTGLTVHTLLPREEAQ